MTDTEIKILMLKHNVKQVDIARKLRVSNTAIHNVIKGISESKRIKTVIAQALGMTVASLWTNKKAT